MVMLTIPRPKFVEPALIRKLGDDYKLVVHHYRGQHVLDKRHSWETEALVVHRDSGAIVFDSWSYCSKNDNPNRKIGRAIAVGKLAKKLWLQEVQEAVHNVG
jgi:hypothetical protein